jgi:glutamate synthase domain-containing protein 1
MTRPSRAQLHEAEARGLYRPEMERDACGVGFVARLEGGASHEVIVQALEVLANLEHRGASASDPLTGDGAGILVQIPEELIRQDARRAGIELGALGTWGLGMLFLPREPARRAELLALFAEVTAAEQQDFLGVREVPVDASAAGPSAQASAPSIVQVLVGPGTLAADDHALERKLYVIRKRFEAEVRARGVGDGDLPYVASLSTRTVVYKGLLTPEQLPRFYRDLADPRAATALAVVHQRFSTNTFPSWSRAHPYRRIAHNGEINTLRGNVNWMRAREPDRR